jgi:hypothetical protein
LNLSITRKFIPVGAICVISLKAFAQSADPSAAREIAKIDGEYSNLSVAKGMPRDQSTGKNTGPGAPIFRACSFGSRSLPSPRAPLTWGIPLECGN